MDHSLCHRSRWPLLLLRRRSRRCQPQPVVNHETPRPAIASASSHS